MTTLADVKRAYLHARAALDSQAWADYQDTLRAALNSGVRQAAIARELDRNRDLLRRDAMTPDQLAAERARKARHERSTRKAARTQPGPGNS
jgi:hypothetical protein